MTEKEIGKSLATLGALQNLGLLRRSRPNELEPGSNGRNVYVIGCVDPRYTRYLGNFFRTLGGDDQHFLGLYPEIGGALRLAIDSQALQVHMQRIKDLTALDFFGPALDVWLTFHQPDCKWCEHCRPKVSFKQALELMIESASACSQGLPEGVGLKVGILVDWKKVPGSLDLFEIGPQEALSAVFT